MTGPALLTSDEAARLMGYVDRSALNHRVSKGDVRLAACRLPGSHRRCWSRARLIAAGYLCAEPAPVQPAPAIPAPVCLVATWRVA